MRSYRTANILLFALTLIVAWYLKNLASQFTCLYFGHHICGGYRSDQIISKLDYTIGVSNLSSLLWFIVLTLAAISATMGIMRLIASKWIPFRVWLILPWAPLYGVYMTHFVVFGDLLESMLPSEAMNSVIAYPLALIVLLLIFIVIPALPLVGASLLIQYSENRQAAE